MYDLIIVGGGLSAATLCACLKGRLRICVLDVRAHLGGNCHDRPTEGSHVHTYGSHIFHSTSAAVVGFLSAYTRWVPFTYRVTAEVEHDGRLVEVPFPYCRATQRALGRPLSEAEVLATFFHGYSRKMWGMEWDLLPASVRGRVPKDTAEEPAYYPGQFVGMPAQGYAHMMENMFDGVEVVTSAGPRDWEGVPARRVVYTGRPDLIAVPGESGTTFGQLYGLGLPHRSLDIRFAAEPWVGPAASRNFCSLRRPHTRKTSYARLTGGRTPIVSTETPREASRDDLSPFYPIPLPANLERHRTLVQRVQERYPDLLFCGRLGTYKYLDMYQAIGQAMALAKTVFNAPLSPDHDPPPG